MGNICVITEGRAVLIITHVSSSLKKNHVLSSLANIHKYLHVKIASLVSVKSCVTVGPIHYGKCLALCILSGLPLTLSLLTEDTSMITVSSCGVKLQDVLSGLEKETLDIIMWETWLKGTSGTGNI